MSGNLESLPISVNGLLTTAAAHWCSESLEEGDMPHPIAKWLAASFLGLCLTQPAVSATKVAQPEKVFGWVEEGVLMSEKISVKIKMDTGALTSSLDAKDLEQFEKMAISGCASR